MLSKRLRRASEILLRVWVSLDVSRSLFSKLYPQSQSFAELLLHRPQWGHFLSAMDSSFDKTEQFCSNAQLWFIQTHAVKYPCAGCYTVMRCITAYLQNYTPNPFEKQKNVSVQPFSPKRQNTSRPISRCPSCKTLLPAHWRPLPAMGKKRPPFSQQTGWLINAPVWPRHNEW